jgi:ubiquinol-cytochrome c reductase cytochrome c subunit
MKLLAVTVLALVCATTAAASNGKNLFGQYCAKCHGPNVAAQTAPSLRGVGAMAADFYLRTGYMPLQHVGLQPRRHRVLFTNSEIKALTAYVASLGQGPAIPQPHPERGNVAAGLHLFTDHCAGCHQVVAEGGYVTGALPPPIDDTPTEIAEAVRIGPYVMPSFSKRAISNQQLDSIVAYIQYAKHPDDRGGFALGHIGPVPEGLVAWLVAAAALVATCMLIGKRSTS